MRHPACASVVPLPIARSGRWGRKKVENHAYHVSLHFMHYNFARIHKTPRVTPAMEAGISDHVWTLEEIADLVPAPVAKNRGPYKKRQGKA